jgi:hypothetical protein
MANIPDIPDNVFIFNAANHAVIEDLQIPNPEVASSQKSNHRRSRQTHCVGGVANKLIKKGKNLFSTRPKLFPYKMILEKDDIDGINQASDSDDEDDVENAQQEFNGWDLAEMSEGELRDFIPATNTYNMFPGVRYEHVIVVRLLLPPQPRLPDDNIDSTLKAINAFNKENADAIHASKQFIIECPRIKKGLSSCNL